MPNRFVRHIRRIVIQMIVPGGVMDHTRGIKLRPTQDNTNINKGDKNTTLSLNVTESFINISYPSTFFSGAGFSFLFSVDVQGHTTSSTKQQSMIGYWCISLFDRLIFLFLNVIIPIASIKLYWNRTELVSCVQPWSFLAKLVMNTGKIFQTGIF